MTLAIDGTPVVATGSGTSLALPGLTTSNSPDVIIVYVESNDGGFPTATSANLTFTSRVQQATGNNAIVELYAIVSAPLSSEVITVNCTGSASFISVHAFAVSGANTSAPFDGNASIPAQGSTSPLTVSTTASNVMVIGGFRMTSPGAGSGYTQISNANFLCSEYQLFSSPQIALAVGTSNDAGVNGSIADAIVAASVSAPFGWKAPVVSVFRAR